MQSSRWAAIVYFVIGQIGWFACVWSAAKGVPWVGSGLVVLFLMAHLFQARHSRVELKFILGVALIGGLWDSVLVHFGLLTYPSGMVHTDVAPYWIIALWALFAAQFNTTYTWLKPRLGIAAVLGAVAGPVTFHAGASLGALKFEKPWPASLALAVGWACLLPLIAALSRRWDGIGRHLKQGAPLLAIALLAATAHADPIRVLHPQGSAHGFVDLRTLAGTRIAVGDLMQRLHGDIVTSRLTLRFFDGSIDDETTIFSQKGTFRFLSDHHIQHGPSFPTPIDVTIDGVKGTVSSTDSAGHVTHAAVAMPPDVYNGMASTMLMNLPASAPETRIAVVIAATKPRIAHLAMTNVGEMPITLGGVGRMATDFRVHVELGGVAGVVAPIIGKEPPDYHVLILGSEDPAFIREEGPLYEGGPIWRLQQISAEFPK